MKKINNRWIDENNNSWDYDLYTKVQAEKYSESLMNSHNCHNCHNCCFCSNCSNCTYSRFCRNCHNCRYCHRCRSCHNCRFCSDCGYFKIDPQRYTTPKIGSRGDSTAIYWTTKKDVQIICGCFSGNLKEFDRKVRETYKKDSEYGKQYLSQIKTMKHLIKNTVAIEGGE